MMIILDTENVLLMARTRDSMEASIEKSPKLIIHYDDNPVGVISVENKGQGEY